ncbi:MAG TPA: type II toxin-antitoxin system death-on-curing family toxin [Tepidiformaceae bacterium]|nr:type II toxin-antitoxin system death-on-curing family toxin [Tepidiformaceae bacterium]
MPWYPTVRWVLAYHEALMQGEEQTAALLGARGRAKLESAIARPQATVLGEDAFPSLAEKAAALMQAMVVGHPFTDGNKRAATGTMLSFFEKNSVPLVADQDALYDFVIAVTTGKLARS